MIYYEMKDQIGHFFIIFILHSNLY